MLTIRDSVEPEDRLEEQDIFLPSPALAGNATPIIFDLPSTMSGTQPSPNQISNTSIVTDAKHPTGRKTREDDANGMTEAAEHICNFPVDAPDRKSKRSKIRSAKSTKEDAIQKETKSVKPSTKRRSSVPPLSDSPIPERRIRHSSAGPESPIRPRKRKPRRYVGESDTEEEIDAVEPENPFVDKKSSTGSQKELARAPLRLGDRSNPRKPTIAVEITSNPQRKSKVRLPLEEVLVENAHTPEPNCANLVSKPNQSQRTPEPPHIKAMVNDEREPENVVLVDLPPSPPIQLPVRETAERRGVTASPPRHMNVAAILAKSPSRPAYRVGLSKRVNIESLHRYLKRNES